MKDEILKLKTEDMNTLGNGIAKADGCVVFCLGAADGEAVTVRICEEKKNYKTAELVTVDESSPHRQEPDCPVFGKCGGCTLRHITYAHETEVKTASVKAALRRAGFGDVSISGIVTGTAERYRNKAVFRFDGDAFGFSAEHSNELIPVSDCLLCPSLFSDIAGFTAKYFADEPLNYLYLRQNGDGSEIICVIGTDNENKNKEKFEKYAEELTEKFPGVCGVLIKSGMHPEDGGESRLIRGKKEISTSFLSMKLSVSPDSFFQVNHAMAQKLCEKAAKYACPDGGGYGADLYCGTGIIGLSVASLYPDANITGVEINEAAVRDAKKNAVANGLSNIGFFCGDSADFAKSIYGSLDFITIDPPRAGCSDKMIKELLRIAPERLVYVSCDPSTLARDLKKLCENKYRIKEVSVFDLFPRTKHVETVCLLSKFH